MNKQRIKTPPNKGKLNKNNLHYLQNDGVKIYGKNWPMIENQISEQIKHTINKKNHEIKTYLFIGTTVKKVIPI